MAEVRKVAPPDCASITRGWACELAVLERVDQDPSILALITDRLAVGVRMGVFQAGPDGLRPDSSAILAIDGDKTVGFATFYEVEGDRLWVHLLWVDEDYRRQGIATDLLQQLEMVAAERGVRSVMLGCMPGNAAMAALLRHEGWPVDHVVYSKPVEG
jgi:GNAT superfamily N-acetyltransferase